MKAPSEIYSKSTQVTQRRKVHLVPGIVVFVVTCNWLVWRLLHGVVVG